MRMRKPLCIHLSIHPLTQSYIHIHTYMYAEHLSWSFKAGLNIPNQRRPIKPLNAGVILGQVVLDVGFGVHIYVLLIKISNLLIITIILFYKHFRRRVTSLTEADTRLYGLI